MPNNDITLAQAEALVDDFKTLNISSQFSTFIPRDQIDELLSQPNSIGINIYNGYADGKIHLVFVSAQTSTEAGYTLQDDLSLIKNTLTGDPEISIVPNDINS